MSDEIKSDPTNSDGGAEGNVKVALQDVVLSNSWALQAILEYLDEESPGAKDRIWQKYQAMKSLIETKPESQEPS